MKGQGTKAQGAIEYLLILGAALVVVAIVISFMTNAIGTGQDAGNEKNYDYICKTLKTNSLICGCYECDPTKGGLVGNTMIMANVASCNTLAAEKNSPLLKGSKCPTTSFPQTN